MKKTIKILSLFLVFTINCNCQVTSIVPFESLKSENPDGAYMKDLNDELPFYVDTWVGVLNNKRYTFEFVKFTQHLHQSEPGGAYYYIDDLMGKFKVEDLTTGSILYNDLSVPNYNDYKIFLTTLRIGANFAYIDFENCSNSADFYLLKVAGNPNQLRYKHFRPTDYINIDCPYANQGDIPMFLPTGDLILTRQ